MNRESPTANVEPQAPPVSADDGNGTSTAGQPSDHPLQIGRYRIVGVLGEGGFGRVYLAHDDQLNRQVAIKVPRQLRVSGPQEAEAYLAEARVVANLDHPNIVPVYDVGSSPDGLCFVVSKRIEGSDLAHKLLEAPLSHTQAAELVATAAEALHYAHRKGLVHRDIKPGNILIDTCGKPYIADFGLALQEDDFGKQSGAAGTPAYMSPEQVRGESHRVDGRSDIFSLGVVFYELLTGRRPFRAPTRAELMELIATVEARPLRQVDDTIPKELERSCLRALAKRATERYTTAKDWADDLRHFLAQAKDLPPSSGAASGSAAAPLPPKSERPLPPPSTNPAAPTASVTGGSSSAQQPAVKIVPKGLRSFDAHDADFFLELLPGPRDRDGLPDTIRFWKIRIEETDPDKTFSVGLICGPSGCGKSSLVKSGLLPHLGGDVAPVYLEATAQHTETRLLNGLRNRCPALRDNLSLQDSLAALRRGQGLPGGKKVLIVLDQFEQWLHAHTDIENTELVQALRQCEGSRVQCIVMVRDDFWMAVIRFMRELEIRLVEGQNSAAVDLFDLDHARRVLAAFGRAFGKLPEDPRETSKEQKQFLEQAVAGLAQEGKVISVRLALFAEMMKGKPWTLAALKDVGGIEGIGATFLEETFSAAAAPPEHRFHQRAARAVLKALLPESGSDIRGQMRPYAVLLQASGYAGRPKDFDDLLRILDGEVRLITPTDVATSGPLVEHTSEPLVATAYYQLTHDYLVNPLRDWLTHKQKETSKGRAELRLAERAAAWSAKPENRHLPSWWEWANIRLFTRQRDWTVSQRTMMRKATRHYGSRAAVVAVLLTVAAIAGLTIRDRVVEQIDEQRKATHAAGLVQLLLDVPTAQVPEVLAKMSEYRRWTDPLLVMEHEKAVANSRQKLHTSLALLPGDGRQLEYLGDRLLDAKPQEIAVIRDALDPYKNEVRDKFWSVVEQPARGMESQRLRAAFALAAFDSNSPRWDKAVSPVVEQLVVQNPVYLGLWMEGFRPVRARLVPALSAIYKDRDEGRANARTVATIILAGYAADTPGVLADLLMEGDNNQFAALYPLVKTAMGSGPVDAKHPSGLSGQSDLTPLPFLLAELDKEIIPKWTDPPLDPAGHRPVMPDNEKEKLAKRQVHAAVALLKLGLADKVWPLLQHKADPRVRSYLIHRLSPLGADPGALVKRLDEVKDASARRALLLALGDFPDTKLPLAERTRLLPHLYDLYQNDPDPGIHGAAGWLLGQWGQRDKVKHLDKLLSEKAKGPGSIDAKRAWCVNGQEQTFANITAVDFQMGSPRTEADREGGPENRMETLHQKQIGRTFALATHEVTVEQFLRFRKGHKYDPHYAPTTDCPVNMVTWFDAAEYCNWLSEQEGIPQDQWCYQQNSQGKYADGMKLKPNYLSLAGYRLPSEAEWEYACRAGALTSRHYGETEELLGKYAWYTKNSLDKATLPVGSLIPNDFGLFDMLGNVLEWTQDKAAIFGAGSPNQPNLDREQSLDIRDTPTNTRVLRGGAFSYLAQYVRSAARLRDRPSYTHYNVGFRPARTLN